MLYPQMKGADNTWCALHKAVQLEVARRGIMMFTHHFGRIINGGRKEKWLSHTDTHAGTHTQAHTDTHTEAHMETIAVQITARTCLKMKGKYM